MSTPTLITLESGLLLFYISEKAFAVNAHTSHRIKSNSYLVRQNVFLHISLKHNFMTRRQRRQQKFHEIHLNINFHYRKGRKFVEHEREMVNV